jgi:hypothetical protein
LRRKIRLLRSTTKRTFPRLRSTQSGYSNSHQGRRRVNEALCDTSKV